MDVGENSIIMKAGSSVKYNLYGSKIDKSKMLLKDPEKIPKSKETQLHEKPENQDDDSGEEAIQKKTSLEKLYEFMDSYRNKDKKKGDKLPWTHSMISYPYGSYNIPETKYNTFLKLYQKAIVDGFQPSITENHKEIGPIVIDLDFVQDKKNKERCYTEKTLKNIIANYNSILEKYLKVSVHELTAFILEKRKPLLKNDKYCDGIHIIYPNICTKPALQMLFRQEFLKLAEKKKLFHDIPLINDLDKVFDKNVIYHTGWLLYGSKKNETSYVYQITHIYQSFANIISDILLPCEDLKSEEYLNFFIRTLSCRKFMGSNDLTPLADEIDMEIIDKKVNKLKEKIVSKSNDKVREISLLMGNDIHFIKATSEEHLVEAKNLVKLFSKQRATDYHTWYQVGACLHNIDYRLLEDWIAFSKLCPSKFKSGECEKLWKKMKPNKYTISTVHYFASQDNPTQYLKYKEQRVNKLVKEGLEGSHHAIAKLIIEKYGHVFRCASIKHKTWYEFKNHRWVEIDSAYTLNNLISEDLGKEYSNYRTYLYKLSEEESGYEREELIRRAEHVNKIILKLNDTHFKDGVIKECANMSYDPNFHNNLDENIYLLCFTNGVYDLETNVFRDGCPDDYISLCTGYDYVKYDKDDSTVEEIKSFLKKIQPNREMRNYMMGVFSTCLTGSIGEENFYVMTGFGANGKSKVMEILKHTLGDYYKPMDIRVLTLKRSSSSTASPEIADKKGIRLCSLDEPEEDDKLNTSFLKLWSGGDMLVARALFKDPVYFKPQFKPFLLCNKLPNIKDNGHGTWRRIKVIPFLSTFLRSFEITKEMKKKGLPPNHFRADEKLSEKLSEWKSAFMCMLLEHYQDYKKNGLIHPKLVLQYTQNYRKQCDLFQNFLDDYLMKTNDANDKISIINLHAGMKSWYKLNYDGKCPNTKELRSYLERRMKTFNPKRDMITGYKIKENDNDELINDLNF
jgi:P4 family phage/plasmid primase-like protien